MTACACHYVFVSIELLIETTARKSEMSHRRFAIPLFEVYVIGRNLFKNLYNGIDLIFVVCICVVIRFI